MNAILDELWVGEDGTIYVGVVPSDEILARPNIPATLQPGTPMCEFVGSLMKRVAARLGIDCAINGIVHGGDDEFTVMTSDGDYLTVNAKVDEPALAQIQEIAQLILAIENLNERIAATISIGGTMPLSRPTINRICFVAHTGNRFSNSEWLGAWSVGSYNVHVSKHISMHTYKEPNRLVRSAQ